MRLKYQSLIALGILSVTLSGCTAGGGGFLNLGVADALRKSKAGLFGQKLTYRSTPLGKTGLSLPTFGSQPTSVAGPVLVDNYSSQLAPMVSHGPVMAQGAPLTSSCGCSGSESAIPAGPMAPVVLGSTEFFMPQRRGEVAETLPAQNVVQPPVNSLPAAAIEKVDLPEANVLPETNALPLDSATPQSTSDKGNNFDNLDTEGILEPLGINEDHKIDLDENVNQEKIVEGPPEKVQSIFETAEAKERAAIKFDIATASTRTDLVAEVKKPKMLTLHARPAQSHNFFDQTVDQQKTPETVQASHRRNYRQQNSLRQMPPKLEQRDYYRQAQKPSNEIDFKPLPPIFESAPTPVLTPKTKLVPLLKTNTNSETQAPESQRTRTAEAPSNETATATKRVPILRATTVSSASILSLKNLANVIEHKQARQQGQQEFFETNSHTARGATLGVPELIDSNETSVER